jgi:hypothetical protein
MGGVAGAMPTPVPLLPIGDSENMPPKSPGPGVGTYIDIAGAGAGAGGGVFTGNGLKSSNAGDEAKSSDITGSATAASAYRYGLVDTARHVIVCHLTQQTRVHSACT